MGVRYSTNWMGVVSLQWYIDRGAMLMVGYDLSKKQFLAQNSFGTSWGDGGFCWMPFNYIRQEVYDVWTFDLSDSTVPLAEFAF